MVKKSSQSMRELIHKAFPDGIADIEQLIEMGYQPTGTPPNGRPKVNWKLVNELSAKGLIHIPDLEKHGIQVINIPEEVSFDNLPREKIDRERAKQIFGKNFFDIQDLLRLGVKTKDLPKEDARNFHVESFSTIGKDFMAFYGLPTLNIRYLRKRYPKQFAKVPSSFTQDAHVSVYAQVKAGWNVLEIPKSSGHKVGTFKEQCIESVRPFRNHRKGYVPAEAVDVVYAMLLALHVTKKVLFPTNVWIRTATATSLLNYRQGICIRMGDDRKFEFKLADTTKRYPDLSLCVLRKREIIDRD